MLKSDKVGGVGSIASPFLPVELEFKHFGHKGIFPMAQQPWD